MSGASGTEVVGGCHPVCSYLFFPFRGLSSSPEPGPLLKAGSGSSPAWAVLGGHGTCSVPGIGVLWPPHPHFHVSSAWILGKESLQSVCFRWLLLLHCLELCKISLCWRSEVEVPPVEAGTSLVCNSICLFVDCY